MTVYTIHPVVSRNYVPALYRQLSVPRMPHTLGKKFFCFLNYSVTGFSGQFDIAGAGRNDAMIPTKQAPRAISVLLVNIRFQVGIGNIQDAQADLVRAFEILLAG